MSKKSKLLEGAKRRAVDVYIEQLDETFRVESLSARELGSYLEFVQGEPNEIDGLANLIGRCLVDEDGNRMFEGEEIEQLYNLDLSIMLLLADACQEVSGLKDEISGQKKN